MTCKCAFSDLRKSRAPHCSSGVSGLLFPLGSNLSATLLMQNRWPVGSGPSSNTWPRWASHCMKHTQKHFKLSSMWSNVCNINMIFIHNQNITHVFTEDLCPSTSQAVVRATNDGGEAFVSLPCPMSFFERWPACSRVILSLWTIKTRRNVS